MKYTLNVLIDAQEDADQIVEWLRERSPQGANAWAIAFRNAVAALGQNPERHALAPEAKRLGGPVREVFFKTEHGQNYRLVFTIADAEVRVLRVRAPGQRPLRRKDIT